MNSGYGKSNGKTGSINAFDFDLGVASGRPKSMNDLKNQPSSYSSSTTFSYSSGQQKANTSAPSWGQKSGTPAWTHQPAASVQSGMKGSLSGPTSMVGDIFGKTWNYPSPSTSVGIVDNKNPNLFGDLLGSAMNKSSSNVPLKSVASAAAQTSFSMGSMADSLPKTGYSVKSSSSWGSNPSSGDGNAYAGGSYKTSSSIGGANVSLGGKSNSKQTLGGPSMRGMAGSGARIDSNQDPFGSFVDFGAKQSGGMSNMSNESEKTNSFGEFQSSTSKVSASSSSSAAFPVSFNDTFGGFGVSTTPGNLSQSSKQPSAPNDFNSLFTSIPGSGANNIEGLASQHFSDGDDWGINSSFPGESDTSLPNDIEGLPPPPAGISVSTAKSKGMDNYKQGQFADAIKWLSWAVILLEKAGDADGCIEVLTNRASCYKEVGEYKKAVADCTKVLGQDNKNVGVLVQRALLYESMEKYKLGAEDLRTVMKLDPGNRVARSTVHRLTKLAE